MSVSVFSVKLKYEPSHVLSRIGCSTSPCGIRWRRAQRWYWRDTSPLPFSDHTMIARGVVKVLPGSRTYGPVSMSIPAKTSVSRPFQLRRTRFSVVPVHSSATPSTLPRSSSTSSPKLTIIAAFDSQASRVPASERYCAICPFATVASEMFPSYAHTPVSVSTFTTPARQLIREAKLSARSSLTGPGSSWRSSYQVSTASQSFHVFT